MRTWILGLVAIAAISIPSARADEEEIPASKLPSAVRKALKTEFPKAKIEKAAREEEDGVTTFEVELTVKGHSVDVALRADGTILEIETEVPLDSLPAPVKKALAARFPKAKIEKVEAVTKGKGGPVSYEIAITTEVVLSASGKIAGAEEEDEDDEKEMKSKGKGHGEAKPKTKAHKHEARDEDQDDDEKEMKCKCKGDGEAKAKNKAHKHEAKAADDDDEDDDEKEMKGKKRDKD